MSSGKQKKKNSDAVVEIEVIRMNDGVKQKVHLPLTAKLSQLREAISSSSALSNCPSNHQRLFYFGRELKTSGRTLENLGLGKFGPHYAVQFHSSVPYQKLSDTKKRSTQTKANPTTRRSKRSRSENLTNLNTPTAVNIGGPVIDLEDSDEDEGITILDRATQTRSTSEPIDLL